MNNLKTVECPRCKGKSFDDISEARSHFINRHCMMCGKTVSRKNSRKCRIREDIDSDTSAHKIMKIIRQNDTSDVDNYTGGFTPVVARELVESSNELTDKEGGPFTQQEFLEYKGIDKERNKGMFCQSCLQKYKELVEEISE